MHTSIEETRDVILRSMPTPEKPWNTRYAIILRPQPGSPNEMKPKMIGVIGCPREADIGYKINEEYWGKGYMTEALAMYLKLFWSLEGIFYH